MDEGISPEIQNFRISQIFDLEYYGVIITSLSAIIMVEVMKGIACRQRYSLNKQFNSVSVAGFKRAVKPSGFFFVEIQSRQRHFVVFNLYCLL